VAEEHFMMKCSPATHIPSACRNSVLEKRLAFSFRRLYPLLLCEMNGNDQFRTITKS